VARQSVSTADRFRLPRPTATGVIAMALAAGFIAWLAVRDNGGASPVTTVAAGTTTAATTQATPTTRTPFGPELLTAAALRERAAGLGQPVYWVGPEPGRSYELVRRSTGEVFLRYLTAGAAAGDSGLFLTIGTYPVPGAFEVTRGVGGEEGAVTRTRADGAIAVYRASAPTNVYLAYPGGDYQIEVFSPDAAQALELALSDRLRPIG
jgi:hypothetical protein